MDSRSGKVAHLQSVNLEREALKSLNRKKLFQFYHFNSHDS